MYTKITYWKDSWCTAHRLTIYTDTVHSAILNRLQSLHKNTDDDEYDDYDGDYDDDEW